MPIKLPGQKKTRAILAPGGTARVVVTTGYFRTLRQKEILSEFGLCNADSGANYPMIYNYAGQGRVIDNFFRHQLHGLQLIKPQGLITNEPIIDLDYLERHCNFISKLNTKALRNCPTKLMTVLTDIKSGQPFYLDLREAQDISRSARCASSVPFFTKIPCHTHEVTGFDGEYLDPLPIRHIIDQGYKWILVLATRPQGFQAKPMPPYWEKLVHDSLANAGASKTLINKVINVHERYNESLDIIENPPHGVTVKIVYPTLTVPRFEIRRSKIIEAIRDGANVMRKFLKEYEKE